MAISQVGRGVFLVSPDQTKRFEDTLAGQLTAIYTKGRHERWELAKDQVMLEYKTEAERYNEEMKAYRENAKQINDQIKANSTNLFKMYDGELKAGDAANRAAANAGLKVGGEVADLRVKGAEVGTKSEGGFSRTAGGPGLGAAPSNDLSPASATQAQIEAWNKTAGAASGDQRVRNLAAQVGPQGTIKTQDPIDLRNALGEEVGRFATEQEGKFIAGGMDPAAARTQARLLARTLASEDNPSLGPVVDSYFNVVDKTTVAAGSGGGFSRTNPASIYDKYPLLNEQFPYLTDLEKAAILKDMSPEERGGLEAKLNARANQLKEDLANLDKPTMTAPDFITRAREVYRGRFGPTTGSPGYADRNALEQLGNLSEPQRKDFFDSYFASRAGEGAPPPPPQSAPPPPQSEPSPTVPPRLPPEVEKAVDNMPSTPAPQPTPVPRPEYTPPPAEAAPVPVSPTMSERIAAMRAATARKYGPSMEPDIGTKPEGPIPPPIPRTMDMTEPVDSRPMDISGAVRPPGPMSGQLPSEIRKDTDELIKKANEAAVKGKGALGAAAPPAAPAGKQAISGYFGQRIQAAEALQSQPDKLKRLTASGPGKVAYQLYTANKAKGFAFIPVTWTEIVNTFAGDPDAMKKAHEVALAAAMTAHDNLTPKA